MPTTRIKADDILTWLECSTAYAYGYNTDEVFGSRQRQYAIEQTLAAGEDIEVPLRKVVSDAKSAAQWWYGTDLFAFLAGNSVYTAPPSPDPISPATDAQWRRFGPRNRGLLTVPLQNYEVQVEFTIPYMHASQNRTRYECVVFDTRYEPQLDEDWHTLVQMARIKQRLFYLATQKYLYTRYINFATCTERMINASPIELEWAVTLMSIADVSHYARPGNHCHRKKANQYLCKARANNQCPIWS